MIFSKAETEANVDGTVSKVEMKSESHQRDYKVRPALLDEKNPVYFTLCKFKFHQKTFNAGQLCICSINICSDPHFVSIAFLGAGDREVSTEKYY